MHHPTDRITHTTAFVTPVVEHSGLGKVPDTVFSWISAIVWKSEPEVASIHPPSACSNACSVWGALTRFLTHLPSWSQTCSVGFMSGDRDGQAMTGIPAFWRQFRVNAAVWGLALSCWKVPWLWHQDRPKHLVAVDLGGHVPLDGDQPWPSIVGECSPDHQASSAETVDLSDTALSMTFTTSSPRPYSAFGETQCESGFVAKDHCVPLSESDMTSSPQKSLLTMYTGKNGTEVWTSGSQFSGAQAVSDGMCGYPPSQELHAGGSCCHKVVTEMT